MVLLVSAVFPVVVFLIYIYRKDAQREPAKMLFRCFFLGCVATIPIIFVEMFLDNFNTFDSALVRSLYDAFIVAALVEEGFKFLFLNGAVWRRREFDQYFDGIVYAVFISLGFALVENIFYVIDGGIGTAIMRAVLSIPGHGLFGVAMGYFFALAKFSLSNKKMWMWLSFLVPVLFHGLYDFFLMYLSESENGLITLLLLAGFVVVMVLLWRNGAKFIKRHFTKDRETIPFAPNQWY